MLMDNIPYAPWCCNMSQHLPKKTPKSRQIYHTWSILGYSNGS